MLRSAATVEPYPVHVGWSKIARDVYGRRFVDDGEIRNVQRAAERMHDVEMTYFAGGRRAGAYLYPTAAQEWVKDRIRRSLPETRYLVESSSYRPPSREDVLGVFIRGCHEEDLEPGLLLQIVALINHHCATSFDPPEVVWWKVGWEEARRRERRALLSGMHGALGRLCEERERAAIEARRIKFGPVELDPLTATQCPLCRQGVEPGNFADYRTAT